MKYLVTYKDKETKSFDYDKNSGWGPGIMTHSVIKKRLFDTKQEAEDFKDKSFVKDNDPKIYECKEVD